MSSLSSAPKTRHAACLDRARPASTGLQLPLLRVAAGRVRLAAGLKHVVPTLRSLGASHSNVVRGHLSGVWGRLPVPMTMNGSGVRDIVLPLLPLLAQLFRLPLVLLAVRLAAAVWVELAL